MRLNALKKITACALLVLLVQAAGSVKAEQLPIKSYTTADGLLRDEVNRIKQDSRGFLWFCTNDGLSRFDGYGFTNYTTDDGLPHRAVNDILETRPSGVMWISTTNGLARFNPKGKRGLLFRGEAKQQKNNGDAEPMFVTYLPEETGSRNITVLFEDSRARFWCGTGDGLYWFEERDGNGVFHRVDLPKEKPNVISEVTAIIEDRRGSLWIGLSEGQGLNRISPEGRIEHYVTRQEGNESKSITTLLETKEGEIWAGMSDGGLCSLVPDPDPGRPIFSRCFAKQDGLPGNWVSSLHQTTDGKLWIGTANGTASFAPHSSTSQIFQTYREAQGLCDEATSTLHEDRDGNLWVATARGVKKIVRGSFVRYAEDDGLAHPNVTSIFVSRTGELFVITSQAVESENKNSMRAIHLINRFDGNRFTSLTPNMPTSVSTGWGGWQVVVLDQTGQWWFPSDKNAAFRFPKVGKLEQLSSVRPNAVGIPDREVFRLYEDSRGDVWMTTMYKKLLLKWEHSTGTIRDYANEVEPFAASCFAEDKNGTLWIGFAYDDRLACYKDGRFTILRTNGEQSGGAIISLHFDRAGRLWLSSSLNGVGRVDNPNAGEQLKVVWYDRRNGLATDSLLGLTEDDFGRIYAGHARGIDRIDPNTDQIKHYTAADGLPPGTIYIAARDEQGSLWFGGRGLARLVPEPDKPGHVPNILLTGLRVGGVRQPVSELGEGTLAELTLDSSQTQVSVDFLGLGASLGEELKYQYKLEGAQSDWSEPTSQRTVDFAKLAPGAYRFLVKAVTAEGTESTTPAVFAFTLPRPVWQRWWFLFIVAALFAGTLYALYRYRVARLVELERIRTRIASDLHDDIGASLSRMAILSEVVKRQVASISGESVPLLADIAESARELTGSMRDIVWAIDPRRDDLGSVVSRIREFASDVLESKGIDWVFHTPQDLDKIQLGPDQRRHVLLFFKEAVNNVARHSDSRAVKLSVDASHNNLIGEVRDDGRGFVVPPDGQAPADGRGGHGLENMRRRVSQLGGVLDINSAPGQGTRLTLTIPLKKP